jgi:ferredoxin-thioredoxin reductase catalytic chain
MMTEEQVLEICRKYADRAGFRLNPDQEIVDTVIKGLIANEKKYGFRYCPCRLVTGDKEKDRAIICPCKYHKDEIKEQGYCHCMLYFAKE